MSIYRFVGLEMHVGDEKYTKFGEVLNLTDAEAIHILKHRGAIVTDADFSEFTAQELARYSNPLSHPRATAAFTTKKNRVIQICLAARARVQAGGPLAPPPPDAPVTPAPAEPIPAPPAK